MTRHIHNTLQCTFIHTFIHTCRYLERLPTHTTSSVPAGIALEQRQHVMSACNKANTSWGPFGVLHKAERSVVTQDERMLLQHVMRSCCVATRDEHMQQKETHMSVRAFQCLAHSREIYSYYLAHRNVYRRMCIFRFRVEGLGFRCLQEDVYFSVVVLFFLHYGWHIWELFIPRLGIFYHGKHGGER